MAEVRQVYHVEVVAREDEGEQHLDEMDIERMIRGEIDWHERIVDVHATKLDDHSAEDDRARAT